MFLIQVSVMHISVFCPLLILCCHYHPQDGIVNPTVRKDMKGSQKLYCCPIEGCPRGPNRPFSQFSLVKQVSISSVKYNQLVFYF